MGLLDGAFSAADDTGGFLSKLARQNRTPADTVAQRFPTAQPGWLQPASMFGGVAPLPLFPPLPAQPDAAAPQSPPAPDTGFAPGTNAPADQGALAGPWTAFQQRDAPSVAPGAATGPWTAFQQGKEPMAPTNWMQQAAPGGVVGPDGQWVSPPQPNPAATPQIATDALVALGQPVADAMNYTASLARGQQPFNFRDALETYGAAALSAMPVTRGEGIAAELAPRIQRLLPRAAESAPEDLLASRSARLYDPPSVEQRPFSEDYRGIARDDGTGRLTHDIEGRPLIAGRIVGRSTLGGADEALSPAEYDAVTKAAIGEVPQSVPAGSLPRDTVGIYKVVPGPDGLERTIGVLRNLPAASKDLVAGHEIGHMIDDLAGQLIRYDRGVPVNGIDQTGIRTELKLVYNALNNPEPRGRAGFGRLWDPEASGYRKGEPADRELMAEAIRAYMVNPNWLKTTAPRTAAAIRAAVNVNPRLSRIIQFNALPLAASAAGFGAGAVDSVGSSGGDDGTGRM
jgi:hypothetical protein